MERKQAALFLGVSLRTLDRLAASGRLSKSKAVKNSKSIAVFQEEELARVRDELRPSRIVSTASHMAKSLPQDTIAFRIDPYYLGILREQAQALGRGLGEHARHIVIRSLERDDSTLILDEVQKLRESLGTTFFAFLTLKLGVPADDARKFIAQTILKR